MTFGSTKTITWGKRLLMTVVIIAAVFYGVLLLAERSKDPIRKGMEDALTEMTGQRGEITEMVTVKMVPDIVLRMNGIFVRDKADSSKALVHAEKMYFSTPTWRMFFGMRNYLGFEIQNLQVAAGYFLPKRLDLNFAGISDPDSSKPSANFLLDGAYNNLPLLVTAEMQRKKSGTRFLYNFADEFPITFKLGELEGDGVFERGLSHISFKQIQIVRGAHRAEFVLRNVKNAPMRGIAEGTIEDIPFNGALSETGDNIVFMITPKSDKIADFKKIEEFIALVDKDTGLDVHKDKFKIEVVKAAELEPEEPKKQETEKK